MPFSRVLDRLLVQNLLKDKFQDLGLSQEAAEKSSGVMSAGDSSQVAKDLARAPKIVIIDENTDLKTEIKDTLYLADVAKTEDLLRTLSQDNEAMNQYLAQYLHQGGFLHASEFLLSYFFRTVLSDSDMLLIKPKNRVATFILHKDGSLSFEESFDIVSIKDTQNNVYKPEQGPIASVTLRSKVSESNKVVSHDFEDIFVKAHDIGAKTLFKDSRNLISQALEWIVTIITQLFSKAARLEKEKLKSLPHPTRKL